jgi:hypothetical protein
VVSIARSWGDRLLGRSPGPIRSQDPAGHRRVKPALPTGNRLRRGDQVLARGIFQLESRSPGPQSSGEDLVLAEGRQHQHRRRIVHGDDLPGRLDPIHAPHADIHHHQVRTCSGKEGQGGGAVGGLPDHLESVVRGEDLAQAGPHQVLVVDQ